MKQKHRLIWQRRHPDIDIFGIEKKMEDKFARISKHLDSTFDNPLRVI
jgi:hypothetical protein